MALASPDRPCGRQGASGDSAGDAGDRVQGDPGIALPAALDRQLQRDAGISNFEYGVLARLSMNDEATMRLSGRARDCDSTRARLSTVMDRFEARDRWYAGSTPPTVAARSPP